MKDLYVFGTSGHAREIADVARDLGWRPIHVAKSDAERDDWAFEDDVLVETDMHGRSGATCVIGIADNAIRAAIAHRHAGVFRFVTLIHPTATFGHRQRDVAERSTGTVVCAGVRLTNHIAIGDFVLFNRNANVGHDVVVGDFVHVAPSACVSGNVRLGAGCWIGAGAVINQGTPNAPLSIGAATMIGSGAVVLADCEGNAVYAGVPARRLR